MKKLSSATKAPYAFRDVIDAADRLVTSVDKMREVAGEAASMTIASGPAYKRIAKAIYELRQQAVLK